MAFSRVRGFTVWPHEELNLACRSRRYQRRASVLAALTNERVLLSVSTDQARRRQRRKSTQRQSLQQCGFPRSIVTKQQGPLTCGLLSCGTSGNDLRELDLGSLKRSDREDL